MVEEAAARDQRQRHDASLQHKEWLRASISARGQPFTHDSRILAQSQLHHTAKTNKQKKHKASSMSTKSIPAHHSSKPPIHRHYHSMNPPWRRCPANHHGNQPATQWRDPNQTPVSQPASRVVPKAAAKRLSDILSNLGDTYVAHDLLEVGMKTHMRNGCKYIVRHP